MSVAQMVDLLACPHCSGSLQAAGSAVRCPAGHSFDIARQGHLNLLGRAAPANADTLAMVQARERFLGSGAYAPLAGAVGELLRTCCAESPEVLVEVGAGTAYYLSRALGPASGRGLAVDISAAAARRAAKVDDRIGAVVADVWQRLPIRDGVADAVLCVFAPRNPGEFARILAPGGVAVVAVPQPRHLAELRAAYRLLDIASDKGIRLESVMRTDFTRIGSADCVYHLELSAEQARDLILMGPNAFHQDPQALDTRLQPAEVTVAVSLSSWRRRGGL